MWKRFAIHGHLTNLKTSLRPKLRWFTTNVCNHTQTRDCTKFSIGGVPSKANISITLLDATEEMLTRQDMLLGLSADAASVQS